jgi:hypothetical protein
MGTIQAIQRFSRQSARAGLLPLGVCACLGGVDDYAKPVSVDQTSIYPFTFIMPERREATRAGQEALWL